MMTTYLIIKDEDDGDPAMVIEEFKAADHEYADRYFSAWVEAEGREGSNYLFAQVLDEIWAEAKP